MTSVFEPFVEISDDEFRPVTDVTYHVFVNGTQAALGHMLPRDRGVIVKVGSALAYPMDPAPNSRRAQRDLNPQLPVPKAVRGLGPPVRRGREGHAGSGGG